MIVNSQYINGAFFNGMPDEMLSARAYRHHLTTGHRGWGAFRLFLDHVFFWQEDHCKACYEWEHERRDHPEDYL